MQVKAISVPSVARRSQFGSAARSLFLAVGREIAACTHRGDPTSGYPVPDAPSVWVGLPVDRDVLLAAWMIDAHDISAEALAAMSPDQVREWALCALLWAGTLAAKAEMGSPAFEAGYARPRPDGSTDLAAYFALLRDRIDEAFGLTPAPRTVPAPASRRRLRPSFA